MLQQPNRRYFSDAARIAAAEARRRKREAAGPVGMPEVYVVRLPGTGLPFGWEIRRFGGIVLRQSGVGYATLGAARSAGFKALSRSGVDAWR